jgi:hypothetical protein
VAGSLDFFSKRSILNFLLSYTFIEVGGEMPYRKVWLQGRQANESSFTLASF